MKTAITMWFDEVAVETRVVEICNDRNVDEIVFETPIPGTGRISFTFHQNLDVGRDNGRDVPVGAKLSFQAGAIRWRS